MKLDEEVKKSTRDEVKPLHVIQPKGVGFTVNGHEIEWQKWKMHAGEWGDLPSGKRWRNDDW